MKYIWASGKGVVMERVGGNEKLLSNNFSNPRTSRDWLLLEPPVLIE